MKNSVQEICCSLRDRITEPRKKSALVQDSRPYYFQICACLDVIEDTEMAVTHFCRDKQLGPLGDRYLEIFGVMQAMFVQQDAVTHLAERLGVNWIADENAELKEIRGIRNHCIGHPTKQGLGKAVKSFNAICQASIHPYGFQVLRIFEDGSPSKVIDYDLRDLASKQGEIIQEALRTILEELVQEENEHRREHRSGSLSSLFQNSDYYCQLLATGSSGDEPPQMVWVSLEGIQTTVEQFKNELLKRGELDADEISERFEDVDVSLRKLEQFFSSATGDPPDGRVIALIVARYLRTKMEELKKMAEDYDAEYGTDLRVEKGEG